MAFVDGSIRILHIKVSDVWTPIGCLTSNNISESSETIVTTTRDNAGWNTIRPVTQSFEIGFTGLKDPENALSYEQVKAYKRDRTRIEWRIDAGAGSDVDYGFGYVTQLEETADAGDLVTFSGTIQGYGKPFGLEADQAPTAPFLDSLVIDNTNETITLNWSGSTDDFGVVGYEIRRVDQPPASGDTEIFDVGDVETYVDQGLVDDMKVTYNVRAYDIAGNRSPWSNPRALFTTTFTTGSIGLTFQNDVLITTQDRIGLQTQD